MDIRNWPAAPRAAGALLVLVAVAACDPSSSTAPLIGGVPVAHDDETSVAHRGTAFIRPLTNDTDPDGHPLSIAAFTQPASGAVDRDPSAPGAGLVYRAAAGFGGVDTFTYTIADGTQTSAPATVRVTVAPNTPPTASPVWGTTAEDVPISLAVVGADLEDVTADLRVEVVTSPLHGTVAPSGTSLGLGYTPARDWSGQETFTVRVVDTEGAGSPPVDVNVTVTPVDDPPVTDPVAALVTDEDVAVVFTVTGSDVDTAPANLVAAVVTAPAHGSVLPQARAGDVAFRFVYVPAPDYAGPDLFTVAVTDTWTRAVSTAVPVSVTVRPVNDLPSAFPQTVYDTEDTPVTVVLTGRDVETPETGLRVELVAPPVHGTLAPTAGRAPLTVTYTPAPEWSGADAFAFRVVDPDGGVSDPAQVSLLVGAVNDPPVATPVAPVVTDEDAPVTITLTGADPDHAVSALVVTVLDPPVHGGVTPRSGIAPLTVTYTPARAWSGADTFRFLLRDPAGAVSQPAPVAITVNAVQRPPVAVADAAVACPGVPTRVGVLRNDSDPDLDPLAIASFTQGAQGRVAIDGVALVYTAAAGAAGADTFGYTVTDGTGRTASATVTVTISGPEVLSLLPARGPTGGPLQIGGRCLGAAPGTVSIGGLPATVTTWTPRLVVVTVPAGLDPGAHDVVVTPPGASPALGSYASVPWIAAVEPYAVAPGDAQTLAGDGFVAAAGTVAYGAVAASIDGWSASAIQSRMPALQGVTHVSATTSTGHPSNAYPVTAAGPDTWWTERVPAGRSGHAAVWTGTELVVHGGVRAGGALLGDGGRYDPRPGAGTWVPIAPGSADAARTGHSAIWTGSQVIVWGGRGASGVPLASGLRYDPFADAWTATQPLGAPQARQGHAAVWTGTRMIVWGGSSSAALVYTLGDGASYDPVADAWTALATTDAPASRYGHAAVWTGKELLVWGGWGGPAYNTAALGTGARYDPATDRWAPMSMAGAPAARTGMVAVWTGEELVIWGGTAGAGELAGGGRYDPETDTWRPLAADGAPLARTGATGAWTGRELVVWGGTAGGVALRSGGRYDPVADAWAPIDEATAPPARPGLAAAWTGDALLVWGGGPELDTGARWDPVTNAWTPMRAPTPGAPAPRRDHAWACLPGGDLLVWGGDAGGASLADGARFHAATRSWTPLASRGAPAARESAAAVWTGTHLLVWGGQQIAAGATAATSLSTGARYDPVADEWTALSTTGAPTARYGHTATWAGGRMIVFGGRNGASTLATGAAYDPVTDTWEALPTLGAPTARWLHTAVAAGGEVIVWGGFAAASGSALATGARLDLASWAWVPLPTGPAARGRHAAVWTGDEMLVIGGTNATAGLAVGGRWIPRLGVWGDLTAPAGLVDHGAVWTGTQVVAWGGAAGGGPLRYDPATRTWAVSAAAASAPVGRARPAMCWTGAEVAVWGGGSGIAGVGGLGLYRP